MEDMVVVSLDIPSIVEKVLAGWAGDSKLSDEEKSSLRDRICQGLEETIDVVLSTFGEVRELVQPSDTSIVN